MLGLMDLPYPPNYSLSRSFLILWWSPLLPATGAGQGLLKNPTAANCDLQRGS